MFRVGILSPLVAHDGIPPPVLYTKYMNIRMCIFLRGESRVLVRFLKEREDSVP